MCFHLDKLIKSKEISEDIKKEVKEEILLLKSAKPHLAVIFMGNDAASEVYIKNKQIACDACGIDYTLHRVDSNTKESDLLELIHSLNNDKHINGILVQLPLPDHINTKTVAKTISYKKDVDCFNPYNIGLLMSQEPIFNSCTPYGCIELLKRKNIKIEGKNCLIIGRSDIVGKPLSMLLLKENATVTIAHSKTENLKNISKNADMIFIAIGHAKFLKKDMIKKGVVIIDIGINRIDGKLYGDCDLDDCYEKANAITPVPGGVGPMTVAILMKNCLIAYKIQNNI